MQYSIYTFAADNAALLLAMVVIYDTLVLSAKREIPRKPYMTGVALGLIGIALMSMPMTLAEGILLDMRSILLGATGLFFGPLVTAITAAITVIFRLVEGGQGTITGIAFIVLPALIGLGWGHLRRTPLRDTPWHEFYLFGLTTHAPLILATFLLLPKEVASDVVQQITAPVLIIYPLVSVLLCLLLNHQLRRKRTDEALRRSEESSRRTMSQLIATLNAIPDQLFELNIYGKIVNLHAKDKHGNTAPYAHLRGKNIHDLIPSSEAEKVIDALTTALAHGTSHGIQIKLPLEHGSSWFELSVSRKGMAGEPDPHFIVLSRDITDRKAAEKELHIAATAFNSQEGLVITDAESRILRVNNAFTEVTGYEEHEVIGHTPAVLSSGKHDALFYREMRDALGEHGVWKGEIWNKRKNGEIYPEWLSITAVTDNQGQVTNYIGAFMDISQRKKAESDIHRLAFYDVLTGLPNRRLLLDRLEQSLFMRKRNNSLGALMFIDLDNFKTLNDTQGHDVGDLLLVEVAKRLKSAVRESDTVARLGGDEFIIILEGLTAERDQAANNAEQIAQQIVSVLHQPYHLNDHEYQGTASVGVSLFDEHNDSTEELLKRADLAMYQAKESGRNTLRFFDPEIQKALVAKAALEGELRKAINEQQLTLHYQAQIHHNRVEGAEVLLRWNHPVRGLVPPNEFIPLAEDSGLIVPIGTWVLETACKQLKDWESDPQLEPLSLAVNVSARQFGQSDFVETVEQALRVTGANPARLKLELTESSVLIDIKDTVEKMTRLKSLGINFAIDDFGTGYSSLFQLKNLPLDQLKIDRSFIRDITQDPDDLAIVQAILAMANNLGIEVIAEGVETDEQKRCLEARECHAFQGFLFSRPLPLEGFQAYIRTQTQDMA